jgi:hypothetical protein
VHASPNSCMCRCSIPYFPRCCHGCLEPLHPHQNYRFGWKLLHPRTALPLGDAATE